MHTIHLLVGDIINHHSFPLLVRDIINHHSFPLLVLDIINHHILISLWSSRYVYVSNRIYQSIYGQVFVSLLVESWFIKEIHDQIS